jgi:hypothetical protein
MRTRFTKTVQVVEKVSLSHLRAFRIEARPKQDALTRKERLLSYEIRDMFKNLSYETMINEKRDLRHLSKPPVKDQIVSFKKKIVFATSYDVLQDTILGTYRRGKNYVKRKIDAVEVVAVIDWDSFAK